MTPASSRCFTAVLVALCLSVLTSSTTSANDATKGREESPRKRGVLDKSPIAQPFASLNGGSFSGADVPESSDPLVAYNWERTDISDPLQTYVLRPVAFLATPTQVFENAKSLTGDHPDLLVKGKGSIRLDFGVESAAWIEFDSPDCPGDVEMSLSEYNEPGVDKARIAVKHGNTYRLELNPELYEGVRFAWIDVKSWSRPWHITNVRAVCQVKPTNYVGSFSCSDPQLTRIWYMAAYGVKASLCKDYFGSILMDRGDRMSWTGDAHPSQAAALVAFGNTAFVKKNLANTAHQDNGIRSYSLYWVLSLLDYYRYTGDAETLRLHLDNACAKLDSAHIAYGTNPGLGFYGWDERLGAGFEIWFRPCSEAQHAYQMLSLRTWSEFAAAMGEIGRNDLRDKYVGYANKKFAELTKTDNWHADFGIHAAADALNTGLLDAKTGKSLYAREFGDRVNRLSLSPFNEYFILQAMARLGKTDDALCTVRDMWGYMLQYGGTTPFEVYRPSWNEVIGRNDAVPNAQCGIVSLCHPWGAGVVKWLNEETLGIKPTTPGFATYDIAPHLGGSLLRVSGATPTPSGVIRASFNLTTGRGQVSAPPRTVGRLGTPKSGRKILRISINGKLAWDGLFHATSGISGANEYPDFVYFNGLQPGEYALETTYAGRPPTHPTPPMEYDSRLVKQDSTTSGDWGGNYGSDGHLLCGYLPDGTDKQSLPSYVRSVEFFRAFPKSGRPDIVQWAAVTADRRALAPDASNSSHRSASRISNNDQTMTLTIRVKDKRKYRIALYFVDWDQKGLRSVVEMFDADTLRMIAPVQLVSGHSGGKYLVYETDRSVKFRFDKIRGDIVTLSGIFFDPAMKK